MFVTTVYNDIYTVAERSCYDDDIVTLIYSVDIASSIVMVFLDEVRRSRRILDEWYGQLTNYI
jgi:hypothetical protein